MRLCSDYLYCCSFVSDVANSGKWDVLTWVKDDGTHLPVALANMKFSTTQMHLSLCETMAYITLQDLRHSNIIHWLYKQDWIIHDDRFLLEYPSSVLTQSHKELETVLYVYVLFIIVMCVCVIVVVMIAYIIKYMRSLLKEHCRDVQRC